MGISESDLTIFWLDDTDNQWVPLPTDVDIVAHTATTVVNHFSTYTLGDGSKPSDAFIPTLQGWQTNLFNGSVSYQYPFDLPAGPGGIKPQLHLSYNSASTDGASGQRLGTQSSWVGKGWDLDVGSVNLNDIGNGQEDIFSLSVNGMAFDLVRTDPLISGALPKNPTQWQWRATDEAFVKVEALSQIASYPPANGQPGRGMQYWGTWLPRIKWRLWTKDGTLYEFAEDMWRGFRDCPASVSGVEAYRWVLSSVTDPHGNMINYQYTRGSTALGDQCAQYGHPNGTVDWNMTLSSITWGGNLGTGANPHYKLTFETSGRVINGKIIDTYYEPNPNQMGGYNAVPHETSILNQITVWSNPSGTPTPNWQVVRD